eukprot:142046_1
MFQARIINTTLSLSTRRSLLPSISSTQSFVRWYRGDSGEMVPRGEITQDEVVERENKLFHIASPKYDKIQERHTRMPTLDGIPEASLPFDMVNSESSREELELE